MKKIFTILLTFVVSKCAYALPVGNPMEAAIHKDGIICEGNYVWDNCDYCVCFWDAWSFRVGFYGDYVFNRHMEAKDGINDSDIDDFEVFTNAGYLVLNFFDRFDLFATLGATDLWLKTPASGVEFPINEYIVIDGVTNFSWSVGGRVSLWQFGCLGIGIEGQYFQTNPKVNYLKLEVDDPIYLDDIRVKYSEWQIGFGPSYRVEISDCDAAAIPYIAAKYSRAKLDSSNIPDQPGAGSVDELRSKKRWGYALGVTFVGNKKWSVTAEGRFADEKALYINSQFRF